MNFFVESRRFLLLAFITYLALKALFVFGIVSQYIEQITLFAFIVILVSLGLNVIYGYTGQFSLGHAAFYGMGAYISAYLTRIFGIEGVLPFLPALILSGLVTGGMG